MAALAYRVEAGGVGISTGVENTEVIENTKREKREKRSNRVLLERIWNADYLLFLTFKGVAVQYAKEDPGMRDHHADFAMRDRRG